MQLYLIIHCSFSANKFVGRLQAFKRIRTERAGCCNAAFVGKNGGSYSSSFRRRRRCTYNEVSKYPSSKKEQTEVVSEFLSARKLLKISNVFPTTFPEDISKAIRATGRLSGAFAFATAGRNPNGKKPSKVFVQSSYGSDRQLLYIEDK